MKFLLKTLLLAMPFLAGAQDVTTFTWDEWDAKKSEAQPRTGGYDRGITVSLLLPLESKEGRADERFVEFYRGTLIAAEELSAQGVDIAIRLFDAPREEETVARIVESYEFAGSDLVIGPVYGEGQESVVTWARERGVPVVSPLSHDEVWGGGVLFGMAPAQETKYQGLREMLSREGVNVVRVATSQPDKEMDSLLMPMLRGAAAMSYSAETRGDHFARVVSRGAENVFVVSCVDAPQVDAILGKISSMYNNIVARGGVSTKVRVVGSPDWAWFSPSTVDRELYFKLGVTWVATYHADRTDARVRAFDARYIAKFGDLPPSAAARVRPYAYRGYDAVRLFAGAMALWGGDYAERVNGLGENLLQTKYRFVSDQWGSWRNVTWPVVQYNDDFTITVE